MNVHVRDFVCIFILSFFLRLVEHLSLISYDLHGAWEAVTGVHSALYPQNPSFPTKSQVWRMCVNLSFPHLTLIFIY